MTRLVGRLSLEPPPAVVTKADDDFDHPQARE